VNVFFLNLIKNICAFVWYRCIQSLRVWWYSSL